MSPSAAAPSTASVIAWHSASRVGVARQPRAWTGCATPPSIERPPLRPGGASRTRRRCADHVAAPSRLARQRRARKREIGRRRDLDVARIAGHEPHRVARPVRRGRLRRCRRRPARRARARAASTSRGRPAASARATRAPRDGSRHPTLAAPLTPSRSAASPCRAEGSAAIAAPLSMAASIVRSIVARPRTGAPRRA